MAVFILVLLIDVCKIIKEIIAQWVEKKKEKGEKRNHKSIVMIMSKEKMIIKTKYVSFPS